MLVVRVDPHAPDAAVLAPAAASIARGGLVVFPTDTLYGLAVDPRLAEAVDALFRAKRRAAGEAVPLVACDLDQVVRDLAALPAAARLLADRFWPGPLALLLPAPATLAPAVHAGTGRVAVRVPDHAVARMLARLAGHPIAATSANISGRAPTSTAAAVDPELGAVVDVLVDAGPVAGGEPSTIVDVIDEEPRLVRAGAVPWDRVLRSLRS